jgi:glycosyltransferase involved in cell wall biosynthesis
MSQILYTAFDVVPSPKGASTHILHFLRGLVNGGYKVHLITPSDGVLSAEEVLEGALVTRVPMQTDQNYLYQATSFRHAVQDHITSNPVYKLVHYRSIWGGLPLAQARLQYNYKTLFEVNGLLSVELKYHYPDLRENNILDKIREQELATLMLSDALICPSEVTRAYLVSLGVKQNRITVIPNGVSTKDFPYTPLPNDDGHIPSLLYIGTFADWQGLDVLIKAMPYILKEMKVHLRIVGRGRSRQRKSLIKHIRKLDIEEYVSLEPAMPHHCISEVITQADLCVAPLGLNDRNILQGCCPIKIIEYMASGRPVVAANLPVVRELVREDIDALLFSPNDAQNLALQVMTILTDRNLAQRISENATERACSEFSWHSAQKRLLKVYKTLLSA